MGMMQFTANTICRFSIATASIKNSFNQWPSSQCLILIISDIWWIISPNRLPPNATLLCYPTMVLLYTIVGNPGLTIQLQLLSPKFTYITKIWVNHLNPHSYLWLIIHSYFPSWVHNWNSACVFPCSPATMYSLSPKIEHNSPSYRQPLFPACWVKKPKLVLKCFGVTHVQFCTSVSSPNWGRSAL